LLTDDGLLVTAGDSCSVAIPVYPGLRLWPQSVTALYGELLSYPSVSRYSEKQRIKLPKEAGLNSAKMSSLYLLLASKYNDNSRSISIKRLCQRDACIEMIRHSFQLDVSNIAHSARLLATASEIAEQLPVFFLSFPHDYSCLPRLHDAILKQHRRPRSEAFRDNKE